MPEPPGSRAAVPEGCSGVLNWEHWEAWSCVGAGRAWGWVGFLVSVVHQRAEGPGYLPALHPSAAGPGGISIREPPVSPLFPPKCQFWDAKGRHTWGSPPQAA